MKPTLTFIVIALLSFPVLSPAESTAEEAVSSEATEAHYTQAIEGRTADILKALALADTNRTAKVHDIIMTQYRSLKAWHDTNDAKLKAAKADPAATAPIQASRQALHEYFLARLASQLTPEQIEIVKDKLTYGKVQFTLNGYLVYYPGITETNKQEILRLLKAAREEAMDGGSAAEKSAVFKRYKGLINNYLSQQGIHAAKKTAAQTETNAAPAKP
jgi:hypothetical protein